MRRFSLLLENQRNFLLKEDGSSNRYEGHIYDLTDDDNIIELADDDSSKRMLMRNNKQIADFEEMRFAFDKKYRGFIIAHWDDENEKIRELVRRVYYGYVTMGDRFEMMENN